jgi:hypothetical protein
MKRTIRPLTPDLWPALEDLFGENGAVGGLLVHDWRIGRAIRENPREENKAAFRNVVGCGPRPGLLAFDGGMVPAHAARRAARAEIAPGGASGWMMSAGNFRSHECSGQASWRRDPGGGTTSR